MGGEWCSHPRHQSPMASIMNILNLKKIIFCTKQILVTKPSEKEFGKGL